jgi:transposase InsO family protein
MPVRQGGRDRIVRLRRKLVLRCKQKRIFKATANSKHAYPVAPNLLEQIFALTGPDEAWVSDITYVATDEGWLYGSPNTGAILLSSTLPEVSTCSRAGLVTHRICQPDSMHAL